MMTATFLARGTLYNLYSILACGCALLHLCCMAWLAGNLGSFTPMSTVAHCAACILMLRGSDNIAMSARLDESAAASGLSQASLAAVLEDGVTCCIALLTSPHAALSMAATARIFYFRARFYTRQRVFSHALTDLAFSQSLNPLDDEV